MSNSGIRFETAPGKQAQLDWKENIQYITSDGEQVEINVAALILSHSRMRFIQANENIVFLGPSGVGKTHLATTIGITAAKKRTSTYFIKCHDLIQNLKRAHLENRLENCLKHYAKYKLLIVDEIGYLPIDPEDAKLFFQLIDARYEKKSTIFTTNVNFKSWEEIFPEPKLANAILDRILHHASVVTITGNSYRLKQHLQPETE